MTSQTYFSCCHVATTTSCVESIRKTDAVVCRECYAIDDLYIRSSQCIRQSSTLQTRSLGIRRSLSLCGCWERQKIFQVYSYEGKAYRAEAGNTKHYTVISSTKCVRNVKPRTSDNALMEQCRLSHLNASKYIQITGLISEKNKRNMKRSVTHYLQ